MFRISNYRKYRLLEMIPGLLIWVTLIVAIFLSFYSPLAAIYFIIIFDFYWIVRIFYLAINLISSWRRLKKSRKVNYLEKIKTITDKNWQDYYHLIFYPTYKEPIEIIDKAFEHLIQSDYDLKKFIVILGGEERDQKNFEQVAKIIQEKYQQYFLKLLITVHPKNLPKELAGKGSNMNYMATQANNLIQELHLPEEKIIVSAFDVDTCVSPQYFACLTYNFLKQADPTKRSYQPLTVYNNNLWESDPVTRVVAISTTFWLLTDMARSERLFTFSSHSLSWQAAKEVDYWQKDIVSEDSRIFLQCLMYNDGNYEVVPIYTSVSMNTVAVDNFWRSLKNQYKQMRRWAWGSENFPYLVWNLFKNKKISIWKKLRYIWYQGEGEFTWATAPILIIILGRLPLWVIDFSNHQSIVAQNAPIILRWLMTIGLVGLVLTVILSTMMMPPKPSHKKWWNYLIIILQWVMVPITMIIFGSIPAIDAQTRLMFGGKFRLGFWVSEKK